MKQERIVELRLKSGDFERFRAVNVWQVTAQDESGKETRIRATNYADASGPYHWPEGLPWTPIN